MWTGVSVVQAFVRAMSIKINQITREDGRVSSRLQQPEPGDRMVSYMTSYDWRFLTFCESHWRPSNNPSPVVAQLRRVRRVQGSNKQATYLG